MCASAYKQIIKHLKNIDANLTFLSKKKKIKINKYLKQTESVAFQQHSIRQHLNHSQH